jgi:hypothetical protein
MLTFCAIEELFRKHTTVATTVLWVRQLAVGNSRRPELGREHLRLRVCAIEVILVAWRRAAVRSNVTPLSSKKKRETVERLRYTIHTVVIPIFAAHIFSYLQKNLFADKRFGEQEFHCVISEWAALASVKVATFWIGRVGGHAIHEVTYESKHMIIEALLRGIAAGRTPLDLQVAAVMHSQGRGDVDYITASIRRLGNPGHRIALGIDPVIIVIVG